MAEAEYDIHQNADAAYVSLVGETGIIGTAVALDKGRGWQVTAHDGVDLGTAPTRHDAALRAVTDWRMRFEGAEACSPTSTTALARELHWKRGHTRAVKAQRNWFCECPRDANLLNSTQWLRDVVETLGGTFPEERPGG